MPFVLLLIIQNAPFETIRFNATISLLVDLLVCSLSTEKLNLYKYLFVLFYFHSRSLFFASCLILISEFFEAMRRKEDVSVCRATGIFDLFNKRASKQKRKPKFILVYLLLLLLPLR